MNHLLFGFALCAALVIYPGGLATVAAALAGGAAQRWQQPRSRPGWLNPAIAKPWPALIGLLLAGLVLGPISWPDNAVAPVGISWASGSDLGGIAMSLGGLLALELLGSSQPRRAGVLAVLGSWSLGLLLLASAVHADSWAGVLGAGGVGAEVARLGLAGLALGSLPWVLWGAPGGFSAKGLAWAAGAGMGLLLALPQLQAAPFPVALGAWWALLVAIGLTWVLVSSWGPKLARRLGLTFSAATLDVP
ncbi:MAG: hypothetical protein ACRENX_07215 [Candidatus Dormibacteria bacterium]